MNDIPKSKTKYGSFIAIGIVMTIFVTVFSLIMSLVAASRNNLVSRDLYYETSNIYGGPINQSAPMLEMVDEKSDLYLMNKLSPVRVKKYVDNTSLVSTDGNVTINADFVKKGLAYQPTYKVQFSAEYVLRNSLDETGFVAFDFPFPSGTDSNEISNAKLVVDGKEVENSKTLLSASDYYSTEVPGLHWEGEIGANASKTVQVTYDTVGISTFDYTGIENSKGAQDFNFEMTISGTRGYDVIGGLSVDEREFGEDYVKLSWNKTNLFSKPNISVSVAERLNPSTQVSRVYFTMAPIYVVFMIVLVFLALKFNTGFKPFDMFLVSVLYIVFFPFFHYLSSFTIDPTMEIFSSFKTVSYYSMPLYLAFGLAWAIVGILIVYLIGRVTRLKFALGVGLPALVLFMGFFPLVVTIPEYSILLVLFGVIALLAIVVQTRSMKKA
ncbi:hypothetical protein JW796_04620 [Candidatus Dojkabacteria bacterium]|nr:hypothetical protein [Candidatus Dojkabacteria bacterium]